MHDWKDLWYLKEGRVFDNCLLGFTRKLVYLDIVVNWLFKTDFIKVNYIKYTTFINKCFLLSFSKSLINESNIKHEVIIAKVIELSDRIKMNV